jgi:hypothetical protein
MKLKYVKGYEGRTIVKASSIDLKKLKTDNEVIQAFLELGKASHFRDSKGPGGNENGNLARRMEMALADNVRKRLEAVGWHAHIFKTGSAECNCRVDLYLHASAGSLCVHQVPFSKEHNIDILGSELFKRNGSLHTKEETLKLLKERIGEKIIDLAVVVDESDVSEETLATVKAIMENEGLTELHEVDEEARTLRSGAKEYTWMDNVEEAENQAREHLMDGEIWRECVRAEKTEQSLEDWVEEVLNVDGWEHELCGYDGSYDTLENGVVYWRTN